MLSHSRLSGALAVAVSLSAAAWAPNAAACSDSQFIGSLCIFGGNFEIRGFAFADGRLLPINQYQALFSILGTTYGGNGQTNFALPDTRGRAVIGPGQGPGLSSYTLGEKAGSERITLTANQMPQHSHAAVTTVTASATANGQSVNGTVDGPGGNTWAAKARAGNYSSSAPNVAMHPDSIALNVSANTAVSLAGGSQPIDIHQPYVAINYLIALQGIFPSRN